MKCIMLYLIQKHVAYWLTHLFRPKFTKNAVNLHIFASEIATKMKNGAEKWVFLDFLIFLALRKIVPELIDLATALPTTWKSGTQVQ